MNILEKFGLQAKVGEVGIEIEMEGRKLPNMNIDGWNCTQDPSLRGNSIEYVLAKPVRRDKVVDSLDTLRKAFIAQASELTPSDRCGVHVHINCQQLTEQQVLNFVALFLILEEPLVKYCGEDREGNLFCLRSGDAEAMLLDIYEVLTEGKNLQHYLNDNIRYSAINLKSLRDYGSLEFRSMRTSPHIEDIATWVDMLLRVKDCSLRYVSTVDMVEGISHNGALPFLQGVFGDKTELLMCSGIDRMIMNGVRRVQDWAYASPVKNRYAYSMTVPGFKEYYTSSPTKPNANVRPTIPLEKIQREHGSPHPGNVFEAPENRWYWDAVSLEWVRHEVRPLTPDVKQFVEERRKEVESQWNAYRNKQIDNIAKALPPRFDWVEAPVQLRPKRVWPDDEENN